MNSDLKNPFELPSPLEKLSHKFILDSLQETEEKGEAEPEQTTHTILEVEAQAEITSTLEAPPNKKYFRMGEASAFLEVQPHVLRYWEKEFSGIRPMKTKSGQRVYSRKDILRFQQIRHLLYVEKFSVEGAKQQLKHPLKPEPAQKTLPAEKHHETLKQIAEELRSLIALAAG